MSLPTDILPTTNHHFKEHKQYFRDETHRNAVPELFFAGTSVTNTILLRPFQNLFPKEKTRWTQVIEDA
jgi:hypothetical protein